MTESKQSVTPAQMMEAQRKNQIMMQGRGTGDPVAQRRTAYVLELETVSGLNLKLIELQRGQPGADIAQFRAVVDQATQNFLRSGQAAEKPATASGV